jgi:hypothetical protein
MDTTRSTDQDVRTWREVARDQGRTLTWLARMTGKSAPTVYSYSQGVLVPSDTWLDEVAALLGVEVRHVPIRTRPAA